jgi:hypothetical protein
MANDKQQGQSYPNKPPMAPAEIAGKDKSFEDKGRKAAEEGDEDVADDESIEGSKKSSEQACGKGCGTN